MSALFGIDYAWGGPPSMAALRANGVRFVARYLSRDPSKNLSAREYQLLRSAGIGLVLLWESTADRALAGEWAGRADALEAVRLRRRCGVPDAIPIHFAVDFDDLDPTNLDAYFRGARVVLPDRRGAYGSYKVLEHLFNAGLITDGYQTYAWSGGRWHPRARIRQYSNGHRLAGVECDLDLMLLDDPAPSPFWPADEARWEREYDQLTRARGPWPALRRRALRRRMRARRHQIWQRANPLGPAGWEQLNRRARYAALLARTE